jgi:regulator of replication initiation timing
METETGEHEAKSGRQVGAENAQQLRNYISAIKANGGRLPSYKGKPDKSAIAMACRFNRQTLYNNPEAVSILEAAVEELGLEEERRESVVTNSKATHLQRQVDLRDRRIRELEGNLEARVAENNAIKKENKELKERLRQYAFIEEVMTTNGRRFRP